MYSKNLEEKPDHEVVLSQNKGVCQYKCEARGLSISQERTFLEPQ